MRQWVELTCVLVSGAVHAADFQREVRPILAKHCFKCHGPDENTRKAKLRLDERPEAELLQQVLERIDHADPDEVMPPVAAKKPLSAAQKKVLRDWVQGGAVYTEHWAFIAPKRPALPKVKQAGWVRDELDRFTLARLEAAGQKPSTEADRYRLIRRVSLDLIGLPPTSAEVQAFVADQKPGAYERLVDRLLASPHFGERWAQPWLDLARYADTNGYEKDRPRSIWPWRDWVIQAINNDLPFDQFTIEQLAGDMLPKATRAQRVATGFHRNTMVNEEGGIDPLEFRFHAMVDRVNTTATTWLGLTLGCAQCHTHKFDPVPHRSYYEMMAFMNNTAEPELPVPTPAQTAEEERLHQQMAEAMAKMPVDEKKFEAWLAAGRAEAIEWRTLKPFDGTASRSWMELDDAGRIFVQGDASKHDTYELEFRNLPAGITALRLEALPDDRLPKQGPGRAYYEGPKGDFFLSELQVTADGQTVGLHHGTENYAKQWIGRGKPSAMAALDGDLQTGWSVSGREGKTSQAVWQLKAPLTAKSLKIKMDFSRHYSASLGRFRIAVTTSKRPAKAKDMPAEFETLLARPAETVGGQSRALLKFWYLESSNDLATARKPIEALRKKFPKPATTLVMQERPLLHTRLTHRHHRGEFLSPRELVRPEVLPFLPPLAEGQPRNRLGLARWLVDPRNPLTARVVVNRYWAALFGEGIVPTLEDFGYTGAAPTQPELLDWLALEFMRQDWSRKKLLRRLVTSATYRQQTSPSFRLSAEQIRDSVLRVSGLLHPKLGGPSVFPPQTKSIGEGIYGGGGWRTSTGPDRYRRSLYTHRKRSMPYAMHDTFDAPSHEACVARREASNTPLQALLMLNNNFINEASRTLGQWAAQEKGAEPAVMRALFQRVLTRPPDAREMKIMRDYVAKQKRRFTADKKMAAQIAGPQPPSPAETIAAWASLAHVLLNTHEFITRN
ncbi:MAG: PSD1 domain-containing protein [Verrucomicrobia subdivision 3 bacterium]|nr:PSD1 domain-containing protein [Limisphaerales bacterium]